MAVKVAWIYVLVINAAAFALFAFDKMRAEQRERRIPESRLLQLAFLGGALGALTAQQLFRHKTRKEPFRSQLILAAGFNLFVGVLILSPELRAALMHGLRSLAQTISPD